MFTMKDAKNHVEDNGENDNEEEGIKVVMTDEVGLCIHPGNLK